MRVFTNKENPTNRCAQITAHYKGNRELRTTVEEIIRAIYGDIAKKETQIIRSTCSYLVKMKVLAVVGKTGTSNIYAVSRDQLMIWAREDNIELEPEEQGEPEPLTSDEERKALLTSVFLRMAS